MEHVFSDEALKQLTLIDLAQACTILALMRGYYIIKYNNLTSAQKDEFNAIATYKSVAENATIEELKLVAAEKLKLLTEQSTIK